MLPMFLRRKLYDLQEKRRIVCEARSRIGKLVGNDPVIEIGCGFGPNAKYCKGPYLGIDISPDAIREAKRRYPIKDFLCGDVETIKSHLSGYSIVLFSAVLHEISDYEGTLSIVAGAGFNRILICDYDPELHGWLRIWMNIFEPHAKRWWGCQPDMLLPESEWSVQKGQITNSLLWWEFTRRPS